MVALCGRRRPTLPRFRRSTIGARGFPPGPSTSTGNREHPLQENLGLLVPLGFAVAGFTPAAYPRRRLRRPSTEVSSSGEFRT